MRERPREREGEIQTQRGRLVPDTKTRKSKGGTEREKRLAETGREGEKTGE